MQLKAVSFFKVSVMSAIVDQWIALKKKTKKNKNLAHTLPPMQLSH